MEADEEGFELAEHEAGQAGALCLAEVDTKQLKHAVDDVGDDGRVLAAAVLAQR